MLAAMASAGSAADTRIAAVDAERLSNLVRHDCGSCHGLTLKGGLGSPLTPSRLAGMDREAIEAVILYGIAGTPMPGWTGILSEDEAAWIAEALKQGTIR
jgi:cytochrome c55X